ncbi:MAG TPA: hypothetical protein VF897_18615 [Roseiflexaceae bacterium]
MNQPGIETTLDQLARGAQAVIVRVGGERARCGGACWTWAS